MEALDTPIVAFYPTTTWYAMFDGVEKPSRLIGWALAGGRIRGVYVFENETGFADDDDDFVCYKNAGELTPAEWRLVAG